MNQSFYKTETKSCVVCCNPTTRRERRQMFDLFGVIGTPVCEKDANKKETPVK